MLQATRPALDLTSPVRFTRWVFGLAGVYGVLSLAPLYFLEASVGRDYPPPITHPEYFYGFVGVALAWQAAFLLIARYPERFRLLILPAILEKASFGVAVLVLQVQHRIPFPILVFGCVDWVWAVLFLAAFSRTGRGAGHGAG